MLNMATMATTSHGLSMFVNSCVKNPLRSSQKYDAYFSEREEDPRLTATDPGLLSEAIIGAPHEDQAELNDPASAGVLFEPADSELHAFKEDQFYIRLQQLKESNRKTLEECEKLYRAKYGGSDDAAGAVTAREMVEKMFAARLAQRSGLAAQTLQTTNGLSPDRTGYMSAKPPPVPGSKRESTVPKATMSGSGAAFSHTTPANRLRPSSAPTSHPKPRRSYSLDDDDWRRAICASLDDSEDEAQIQDENAFDPELETAMDRIKDMWQDFRTNDYTTYDQQTLASRQRSKRGDERCEPVDNWRHRITIPKPFQVSLRESTKIKKKTKAQQEVEEKRRQKERQEEEECQKKFKAQPAPAHIYMPLYDEIQEKNEARRRYVKQHSQFMLKSQEKPFNFIRREEEKKMQRTRNKSVAERIATSAQKAQNKERKFSARPVPEFVVSNAPSEKLLEEEEYRKIRIKMRARELLREAALPPNMEMHEKLKEQREKEKLMKAKQKSHSKRRPKSAHQMPDYDHMYRQFQKELARTRKTKEATAVEPFSLTTSNLRSSRERIFRDMERDEKVMRETARTNPRLHLGVLSSSMDSIPLKSSASADLRTEFQRTSKERSLRLEEQRQEEEHRRRLREGKLRQYILERGGETPRVDDVLKAKVKQHKEAEIARLEQYEKDLEEMKERIQKRPLLFERETQSNAGKAAERKFQTTLKSAGVDEEFLQTRSSAAPSTHSENEYSYGSEEEQ